MKRIVSGLLCSLVMLSLALPFEAYTWDMSAAPRLRVYVGEVTGDEDLVKSVRSQLVDELAKRGIALAASEEEADATVRVVGVRRAGTHVMFRTRSTVLIVIRGDLQVIARDGIKLWSSDVSSTRWAFNETASFAKIAASRIARMLRQ